MSDDDPIPSLAEALTEIRRLRARAVELEATRHINQLHMGEALRENDRLRARILELEANSAVILGTLATTAENEPPRVFVRNVPPNAPPHDETP